MYCIAIATTHATIKTAHANVISKLVCSSSDVTGVDRSVINL